MMRIVLRRMTLVVALIALLGNTACKEEQPAPAAGGPAGGGAMPVKVGHPIIKKLTEWDEFTGRFRAREQVDVRARVNGYLDEIRFTDGQAVAKGDVLFVIDPRPFRIALERAQARHDLAEKEYERAKGLVATSAMSQQEVDKRYQEFLDAKAQLNEASLNIEFTEVKSPINGRVGRNLVDVGNLISGGDESATLLTTVVSKDPIDFYFEASEQEVLKYTSLDRDGSRESSRTAKRKVFVKLQNEKEFVHEGEIDFVDNIVDQETGTLQARAVFANPDDRFLPGIFGRMRMAGSGEYEAMLVPDDVIGTNQSQKFVYTVNAENKVEPRPVVLGPLHDNNLRIIREGLTKEDTVIMGGITILRPGMPVSPMPMEEALDAAPEEKAPDAESK